MTLNKVLGDVRKIRPGKTTRVKIQAVGKQKWTLRKSTKNKHHRRSSLLLLFFAQLIIGIKILHCEAALSSSSNYLLDQITHFNEDENKDLNNPYSITPVFPSEDSLSSIESNNDPLDSGMVEVLL